MKQCQREVQVWPWFSYTGKTPTSTQRISLLEYSVSELMKISWNIHWNLHSLTKSINNAFHWDHLCSESIFKGLTLLFLSFPSLCWVYFEIWKRATETLSLLQMPDQKPREMKDLVPCSTYWHTSLQCGGKSQCVVWSFSIQISE